MITIDKEYKKEILALQKLAEKHSNIENVKFAALCKKMNMDPDGPEGDALFDYIYNKSNWTIDFS